MWCYDRDIARLWGTVILRDVLLDRELENVITLRCSGTRILANVLAVDKMLNDKEG